MRHNTVFTDFEQEERMARGRVSRRELDAILQENPYKTSPIYDAVPDDKHGLDALRAKLWQEAAPLRHSPAQDDLDKTLRDITARREALAKLRLDEQGHKKPAALATVSLQDPPRPAPKAQQQGATLSLAPLKANEITPFPQSAPQNSAIVQTIQTQLQQEINQLAERIARTIPAHGGGGGGGQGGCTPEQIANFNRQLAQISGSLHSLKTVNYGGLETKIDQLHAQLAQPLAATTNPQAETQWREDLHKLSTRMEDINNHSKARTDDFVRALQHKLDHLTQVVATNLQEPSRETSPLAAKIEAIETRQTQNMAALETLLRDIVGKIEHQPQTSQDLSAFEGLVTRLASRIETSDKRFETIETGLAHVMRVVERGVMQTPLPQQGQDEQLHAVQAQLDKLMQKLEPQAQQLQTQVAQKERVSETAAPQAYQEAIRLPPQRPAMPQAASAPSAQGNHLRSFVPQSSQDDQPLEIGAGAPRFRQNRLAQPQEHAQAQAMPEMKSNFISSAKRLAQAQAQMGEMPQANRPHMQKNTPNQSQVATPSAKKKILLTLASLLVLLAGLKLGYDYLSQPTNTARPVATQKETQKPLEEGWKKAPLSQVLPSVAPTSAAQVPLSPLTPQFVPPQTTASAPPQGIDPLVTGASQARPVMPGTTVSAGWAPVMPTAQEKAIATIPPALKRAAELGNPSALYELGNRHADGVGAPKNFTDSFKNYKAAADGGLALAQFRLAGIYEKGAYGERDIAAAITYYGKAAKQGHINAMYNLGVLLASPAGGNDHRLANHWFGEAAQHGFIDAQYNLAAQYLKGQGIEKNAAEAFKWFAIAGNAGDKDSQLQAERLIKTLSQDVASRQKVAIEGFIARPEASTARQLDLPANGWGDGISVKDKPQGNS